MSATQTEAVILHKLHLLIVLIFHIHMSVFLLTAQEEVDCLPALLCGDSSLWLAAVWLQHWGHQCTRGGVCL